MIQKGRLTKHRARITIALLVLLMALTGLAIPVSAQDEQVLVVEIEGPVTPAMASYFQRAILAGERNGVTAIVIILDTPGGAVDITLDIVQDFRNAEVPIIVYIAPAGAQAASAGSIITAAAHAAGMAPETVIGAASPVDSSGADVEETLFKKITEDLKATMRNLTERRGQSAVTLAEEMIEDARAVTATEALEAALIDVVASDVPDLLAQLDGLTVEVGEETVTLRTADASRQEFSMSFVERVLHALSNPLLIGILLTIGVQAILIEISSPGGWIAGFIGVVCLALALYGLGTLPANWFGLVLVAIGFVLLLLEVMTPATGALAIVGTLTLLAGLLMLFNSPGTPEFARISIPGAITISAVTAAFFLFIITKALQAQRRRPLTGMESMVGNSGPAKSDLTASPEQDGVFKGTVLVKGEIWRAVSDEEIISGEEVIVEGMDGFTLQVKKKSKGS